MMATIAFPLILSQALGKATVQRAFNRAREGRMKKGEGQLEEVERSGNQESEPQRGRRTGERGGGEFYPLSFWRRKEQMEGFLNSTLISREAVSKMYIPLRNLINKFHLPDGQRNSPCDRDSEGGGRTLTFRELRILATSSAFLL